MAGASDAAPEGAAGRPPLARWWASAGAALVVALGVSVAAHAAGLPYPATAGIVAVVTVLVVGGLHLAVRRTRDPLADLRDLAEGRLEPTAPSTSAVMGVGLFVFDQVVAAVIGSIVTSTDSMTLSLLASYALPAAAAFGLACWAGRFSERPFVGVLAGAGMAVLLDTVVLVVGLGIPVSSFGEIVPVLVGYWTVRGAVLLTGGMAGAVVSMRGRHAFLARREARLTAALRGRGEASGGS